MSDHDRHEFETNHRLLKEILSAIHTTNHHLSEIHMAVSQAVQDVLAKLDKATNDIGAKLDALKGQINTGMSQADVDSVVSQIGAEADKLEGLASDPANPVPTP